ncbi:MAG: phosphoribosylamine--glycine ligase [Nitrospinota bacterium]
MGAKVLVVGGGGREHALAWKLSQSPEVAEVLCAPGNGGTAGVARNVPTSAEDVEGLLSLAAREGVDFTAVGPEAPLVAGIGDRFAERGHLLLGPTAAAARIEGSKAFAKELMREAGVHTAEFHIFDSAAEAKGFLRGCSPKANWAVKADGLAAGKGVLLCRSREEALAAVEAIMEKRAFGEAGSRVVVEDLLGGEEASCLALSDGERFLLLPSCQDHKAIGEGDTGPNTGGMGAYSPAPVVAPEVEEKVRTKVLAPTLRALARRGTPYRGVLYAGLMVVEGEPLVLEFNCRFGDPEAQPLMVRLEGDLLPALRAAASGDLRGVELPFSPEPAVCVVMAAEGYPGPYRKGDLIEGLEEAAKVEGVTLFHAGTARQGERLVTSGGRVLGVTARAPFLPVALERAYRATGLIRWRGAYYRRDIGGRALARWSGPG